MTLETVTTFFGWLAVINIAYLALATCAILVFRDWITGIHGKLFGLEPSELGRAYFSWLGTYKTLTLVFAVAPYIALKLT